MFGAFLKRPGRIRRNKNAILTPKDFPEGFFIMQNFQQDESRKKWRRWMLLALFGGGGDGVFLCKKPAADIGGGDCDRGRDLGIWRRDSSQISL